MRDNKRRGAPGPPVKPGDDMRWVCCGFRCDAQQRYAAAFLPFGRTSAL